MIAYFFFKSALNSPFVFDQCTPRLKNSHYLWGCFAYIRANVHFFPELSKTYFHILFYVVSILLFWKHIVETSKRIIFSYLKLSFYLLYFNEVLLSMRTNLGTVSWTDYFSNFLPIPVIEFKAYMKENIPKRNLLCSYWVQRPLVLVGSVESSCDITTGIGSLNIYISASFYFLGT